MHQAKRFSWVPMIMLPVTTLISLLNMLIWTRLLVRLASSLHQVLCAVLLVSEPTDLELIESVVARPITWPQAPEEISNVANPFECWMIVQSLGSSSFLTPHMLFRLLLYMSRGTCRLKSTLNDNFRDDFHGNFIYLIPRTVVVRQELFLWPATKRLWRQKF